MRRVQGGVALIAVLSLLALLSVLAFGVLDAARRHGQLVRRSADAIQAQEYVDSALRLTILDLSAAGNLASPPQSHAVDVFGQSIAVTIELESGRIDLNTADAPLLIAAFAGNGVAEATAREFADGILDWRDVDDEPRQGGAERGEYERLRRAGAPRNGPFESVAELRRVVGLETIESSLLEAFTVYTRENEPSEAFAPPAVINALRWAHERQLEGRRWLTASPSQSSALGDAFSFSGRTIRLRACTRVSVSEACRGAIVRLTGDLNRPAMIYSWASSFNETPLL
jgi:general secretion pathway protein K